MDPTLIIAIVLLVTAVLLVGGLAFALVIGAAVFFFWRRSRSRAAEPEQEAPAPLPPDPQPVSSPASHSPPPDPSAFPSAFGGPSYDPAISHEQPTEAFHIDGMRGIFDDDDIEEGATEVFTLDNQQMAGLLMNHEDDDEDEDDGAFFME